MRRFEGKASFETRSQEVPKESSRIAQQSALAGQNSIHCSNALRRKKQMMQLAGCLKPRTIIHL
jgi:hypothetical protein